MPPIGQNLLFGEEEFINTTQDIEGYIHTLYTAPCHECRLGNPYPVNRSLIWKGNLKARIAVVSKAPAEREMESGRPMVGPAGQEFDQWMRRIGINTITDTFVVNVVQCCPPRVKATNRIRDPKPNGEISRCFPRVQKILNSLPNLEVVLIVGSVAAGVLLPGLSDDARHGDRAMHGTWFESTVVPGKALFYLPHPADFLAITIDKAKYGRVFEDLACFKREYLASKRILSLLKNKSLPKSPAVPASIKNEVIEPW